jgi:hypothetical protein
MMRIITTKFIKRAVDLLITSSVGRNEMNPEPEASSIAFVIERSECSLQIMFVNEKEGARRVT